MSRRRLVRSRSDGPSRGRRSPLDTGRSAGGTLRTQDYYALLDVPRGATPEALRYAYELALSRANRDGATRHMVDIVAAYEVLSDPDRRRSYDATGVAVRPERVPNTHGRSVAFRDGHPGLGHGRRRGGVPGETLLPAWTARPRRRVSSGRLPGLLVVAALAGAGAWALEARPWERFGGPSGETVVRVVPASAVVDSKGLVSVRCPASVHSPAYVVKVPRGASVSCAGGVAPQW